MELKGGDTLRIWVCVTKPGNWRRVGKHKIFGFSQHAAGVLHLVKRGDIVLVHVLRPINGIVAVYRVKSLLRGTRGVWDESIYPFGIELEQAEDFKTGMDPISLSSLMGSSSRNVEISPFLKGVPIFEVPKTVLQRLEHTDKPR
jgi:hypothetical protein